MTVGGRKDHNCSPNQFLVQGAAHRGNERYITRA